MDFKFYIKQASYYKKVLKDWRSYLESFQESTLSSKKSKFKVRVLNDRKELIHCSDLEELELYDEIKEIHNLIKKEKELYNNVLKLIQTPEEVGFFTSKSKAKKTRNEQLSKHFKKLLSINSEQTTRINLFITSLELFDVKNEKTTLGKTKNETSTKVIISTRETDNTSIANTVNNEVITNKKQLTADEATKNTNLEKEKVHTEDFDYETEMKRILGI